MLYMLFNTFPKKIILTSKISNKVRLCYSRRIETVNWDFLMKNEFKRQEIGLDERKEKWVEEDVLIELHDLKFEN